MEKQQYQQRQQELVPIHENWKKLKNGVPLGFNQDGELIYINSAPNTSYRNAVLHGELYRWNDNSNDKSFEEKIQYTKCNIKEKKEQFIHTQPIRLKEYFDDEMFYPTKITRKNQRNRYDRSSGHKQRSYKKQDARTKQEGREIKHFDNLSMEENNYQICGWNKSANGWISDDEDDIMFSYYEDDERFDYLSHFFRYSDDEDDDEAYYKPCSCSCRKCQKKKYRTLFDRYSEQVLKLCLKEEECGYRYQRYFKKRFIDPYKKYCRETYYSPNSCHDEYYDGY